MSSTNGPDLINGNSAANTIDGMGGDDIIFARAGDDVVDGGADNDLIFGQPGTDSLLGGEGDDELVGGRNDDTLDGGTGIDIAGYEEARLGVEGSITVTLDGGGWVVQTATIISEGINSDGTDHLEDIEIVEDADGARVLLVGAGGFATLQEAVDAAASGDTILIADGTYAGATITGKALTIRGQGAGSTTIDGQITIDGTVTGDTVIEALEIDASGEQFGVYYNAIAGDADSGLTLDGVSISGAAENGLLYTRPGNSSVPTITTDLLSDITIRDSVFTDNGTGAGSNGRGHVNLFGFNGDLTVDNNDFNVTAGAARKGFSWTGAPRTGPLSPAGDVVFTGNDFSGDYLTDAIAFYYFASFASFTAFGNTADVSAPWGVLNADIAPALLDVSGFFAGTPLNAAGPVAVLQGAETSADTLTGTDQADVLRGRGGADDLDGGGGDDLIIGTIAEIAPDSVAGGTGADTLRLTDTVAGSIVLDADVTGIEAIAVRAGETVLGAAAIDVDASALAGVTSILGNDGANALTAGADAQTVTGNGGNDTLTGGAGGDSLSGGAGIDTATYGVALNVAAFSIVGGAWQVDAGAEGTDSLGSVEVVTAGGVTYRLVGAGGYATIQAAVDAAGADDVILIAPGTYTETSTGVGGGQPQGLYINTAGLTLVGFSSATGLAVVDAAEAKASGPVVIAGAQNQFGANHWIDVGGTGTVIHGLHMKAGPATGNKLLEIWADGTVIEDSYLNVYATIGLDEVYSFAAAIYINETIPGAADAVTSYDIRDNILNEGIIVASGVGDPAVLPEAGSDERITGNVFEDSFSYLTGEGRYDTVVINGEVDGIGWLIEPTGTPWIAGNTFSDNTVPFLLRGSDNSAANLPSAATVAAFLANNGDATTTYAYAVDSNGDLVTAERDVGGGPYRTFAVLNTIATLNLALDATPDAVFGDLRQFINPTDTLIVQSGPDATDADILVDDITVQATATSADLNLTLGTVLVDGTPIVGGGVVTLALGDHAPGLGADVDVTGNALGNVITGNSGDNLIDGVAGSDTLAGGAGLDTLLGGDDDDVIETDGGDSIDGGDGIDDVRSSISFSLATDATGVENLTLTGTDDIDGTGDTGDNALTGNSGANLLDGGAGADSMAGGEGDDTYVVDDPGDAVTETAGDGTDLVLAGVDHTLADEFENLTLTGTDDIDGTGNGLDNVITGNTGANRLDGNAGADTMTGGDGNDTYVVDDAGDAVTESAGEGTDLVLSTVSVVLSDHVENLTLTDGASDIEDFEAFGLGPISDGENGWRFVGGAKDQEVVDVAGDQKFRMSSDPSVGDFSGPYSPGVPATAGEPGTTADYDSMQITFDFQAAVPGGDQSRLEVDFGIETGTDRNNFMVIENTAAGIRIAVADPLLDATFDTGNGTLNNFTAFTGNRTLVSGVDSSVAHSLTMAVTFLDGPDNDIIDFYLDGAYIGTSTTFENYRVGLGQDHDTAAEANQVNRLFFRGSAAGAPTDGAGDLNQGFLFDDIAASVFDAAGPEGTGNALANVITGNSGGNALAGEGAADTLAGELGADTLTGGAGEDEIDGGLGIDVATYAATLTAADIQGVAGGFTVAAGAPEGTDTLSGVEIVEHGGTGRFLLVGDGGFATLAAALAVAAAGDTIILEGGSHPGDFAIGFDLTILGRGSAAIGGGIVLTGGDLVIEDVAIEQYEDAGVGIQVLATAGNGSLTLNNVAMTGPGAQDGSGSRGVEVVANGAPVTVTDGVIGEFTTGIYLNPGSSLTVSGTSFAANLAGIGTDAPALLDVQSALFDDNGEAIGFTGGTLNPDVILANNTYVFGTDQVRLYGTPNETLPGSFDGVIVSAPASLQDALDAAAPGETVFVGAGDYGTGPFTVPSTIGAVQGGDDVIAGILGLASAGTLTLLGTADFAALGTAGADTILGNDGDNALDGAGSGDSLAGGVGSDSIDGGLGADTMAGGTGDDVYAVSEIGDVVSEAVGEGSDEVRSAITLTLGAAVEDLTLTGIAGIGGTGNELANVIAGNEGANSLSGLVGDDTMLGGAGADTLRGGLDDDSMVGGEGIDTAEFFSTTGGVMVDLAAETASGFGNDTLVGIENVLGTNLIDSIAGDGEDNRLVGRAGDDDLSGLNGNDTLEGGAGGDFMLGGDGIDLVTYGTSTGGVAASLADSGGTVGDAMDDTFSSIENLAGGTGNDTLEGNGGGNSIEGFLGNDLLRGLGGDDSLNGGNGIDTASYEGAAAGVNVQLGSGTATDVYLVNDMLLIGTDTLLNMENVVGSSFGDTVQGSTAANLLEGGEGDDSLNGGNGFDTVVGGAGVDQLAGTAGNDVLIGGAGFDILNGGTGNDIFRFLADSDLGTTRAATDRISAFDNAGAAAGDVIDFSALDADLSTGANDEFVFLGNGNFAFSVAGQIRAVTVTTVTYLEINNDGDMAVDLVLRINAAVNLDAESDLIL